MNTPKHTPDCKLAQTGRYTADCEGCLAESRKFTVEHDTPKARWNRSMCREQLCTCHDDTALPYVCHGCGCQPAINTPKVGRTRQAKARKQLTLAERNMTPKEERQADEAEMRRRHNEDMAGHCLWTGNIETENQ
jgi:hypothetical protein